jgi:intracellular septation protein
MSDDSARSKSEASADGTQLLKMAIELGPLAVFFLVNSQAGRFIENPKAAIFWGTGAFMAATFVALILSKALFGRVPMMPLISGAFVLIFGGLTLLLQDELFIKMKPTIVNSIFAAALFGGLLCGRALLKYLFGEVFRLTEQGWRELTFRWACFFVVLALLNEIVWRWFSTDFWIGFKMFGIMPLTIAFAIAQLGLLKRHELQPPA